MQPISLVFIRKEYRLIDNPLLHNARKLRNPIMVVFCLPDWKETHLLSKLPRIGGFRKKFLIETIRSFQEKLEGLGCSVSWIQIPSPLNKEIIQSQLESLWEAVPTQYTVQNVLISDEPGYYEKVWEEEVIEFFQRKKIPTFSIDCNGLVHVPDLNQLPMVFTQFLKEVESRKKGYSYYHEKNPLDDYPRIPIHERLSQYQQLEWEWVPFCYREEGCKWEETPIQKDPRAILDFVGGEEAGIRRMEEFLWKEKAIFHYKETRNGMLRVNDSSKLSPWLAVGALSPQTLYREIEILEDQLYSNESTYWLKYELLWREYFRWIARKFPRKLFHLGGIQGKQSMPRDTEQVEKWRLGETGQDFIDANMKELFLTGFLSNRGRQNVASYLVHHLKQDWRWGAEWFETQLVDYDVASNWGNWNYVAGVGNDPRNRVFNPEKQASDYDPQSEYRKYWLGGS